MCRLEIVRIVMLDNWLSRRKSSLKSHWFVAYTTTGLVEVDPGKKTTIKFDAVATKPSSNGVPREQHQRQLLHQPLLNIEDLDKKWASIFYINH